MIKIIHRRDKRDGSVEARPMTNRRGVSEPDGPSDVPSGLKIPDALKGIKIKKRAIAHLVAGDFAGALRVQFGS